MKKISQTMDRVVSSRIQCNLCQKVLPSKLYLEVHVRTHTNERPFKCFKCSARFALASSRNLHVKNYELSEPFECPQCPFKSCNLKGVQKHQSKNHKNKERNSKTISLNPPVPPEPTRKSTEHENSPDLFSDSSCDSTSAVSLNQQSLVTALSKSQCPDCSFTAATPPILASHIFQRSAQPLKCHLCNFRSCTSSYLEFHQKEAHDLPSSLDIPSQALEDSQLSQQTIPIVSPDHSENDSLIGTKNLQSGTTLKDFIRKTKHFKCKNCSYVSTLRKLFKHKRLQDGPPSKCSKCDYICCDPWRLKKHMDQHSRKISSKVRQRVGQRSIRVGSKLRGTNLCSEKGIAFFSGRLAKRTGGIFQKRNVKIKLFKCNKCSYVSPHVASIQRHMDRNSQTVPHNCSECNFMFCNLQLLRSHMKQCHQKSLMSCNIIVPKIEPEPEEEEELEDLLQDLPVLELQTNHPFFPEAPGSPEPVIPRLERIYRVEDSAEDVKPEIFYCFICNYGSTNKDFIAIHEKSHSVKTPYKCHRCYKVYSRLRQLWTHTKNHLMKSRMKSCRRRRIISGGSGMNLFSVKKLFKCNFCWFQTVSRAQIGLHGKVHCPKYPKK